MPSTRSSSSHVITFAVKLQSWIIGWVYSLLMPLRCCLLILPYLSVSSARHTTPDPRFHRHEFPRPPLPFAEVGEVYVRYPCAFGSDSIVAALIDRDYEIRCTPAADRRLRHPAQGRCPNVLVAWAMVARLHSYRPCPTVRPSLLSWSVLVFVFAVRR